MAGKKNPAAPAGQKGPAQRHDANARIEHQHFSGRSSKDAAKVNKAGAAGTRNLEHGEQQRSAPNSPRHGG